jgi:hypothetical protein
MASESSGTDFSARVFKFCANITDIVILICVLEDQRVTNILKMFTFTYLLKISNSLQLRKVNFSILRSISTFQLTKVVRFLSYSTLFKITNSKCNEFFVVLG